jgi:hypothetical protein
VEKFEEQMFTEIGGSPEEILQFILHIPVMEKFEEQMFFCRDWRQPR